MHSRVFILPVVTLMCNIGTITLENNEGETGPIQAFSVLAILEGGGNGSL